MEVTYDYYRTKFYDNFNIGFGASYVDTWVTCSALESTIASKNGQVEKIDSEHKPKAHKVQSYVIYKRLKEDNAKELTLIY